MTGTGLSDRFVLPFGKSIGVQQHLAALWRGVKRPGAGERMGTDDSPTGPSEG